MTAKTLSVGSVSSGTMLASDLVPTFAYELSRVCGDDHADLLASADAWVDGSADPETNDHDDAGNELVDELMTALGDYCPDYCYFGAHEGDGADYGVWVSWDSVEDARRDGELESGDEIPDGASESGMFLVVSDHGNATLYRWDGARWVEVWGIV